MKRAAVDAIAALAREAPSDVAARAYGGEARTFGTGSLIPNPFDPRLILRIAPAVAKAAMRVRRRDAADHRLRDLRGAARPLRVPLRLHHEAGVHAGEGRAASASSTPRARTSASCAPRRSWSRRGSPCPLLIGRPAIVEARLERFGLSIRPGPRFRADQSGGRSALPHLCATLCRGGGPQGHHAGRRAHAGAHQRHRDRGARA